LVNLIEKEKYEQSIKIQNQKIDKTENSKEICKIQKIKI